MAILPANRNLRNDLWIATFKVENFWGRENNLVRQHGHLFGIVEAVNFPDPNYEFYTYRFVRPTAYMPAGNPSVDINNQPLDSGGTPNGVTFGDVYSGSVGTPSVRNWVALYDVKRSFAGGIPDIRMTSGHILPFIFGAASNEGVNTINGRDYFLHYILERSELPSFTMELINFNTSGVYDEDNILVRRARGCKINKATISADEGEQVRISIDEMLVKGVRHNIASVASTTNEKDYYGYHSNLDYSGSDSIPDLLMGTAGASGLLDPTSGSRALDIMNTYKFSEGSIEILRPDGSNQPDMPSAYDSASNPRNVSTLGKIKSFKLTVNNNLGAKYFINDLNRASVVNTSGGIVDELIDDSKEGDNPLLGYPGPTLIVEGAREYELEITAAVSDTYLYQLLMSEGKFGREKRGLGVKIRFERQILGNTSNAFAGLDYMEIDLPADTSGIEVRKWGDTFAYNSSSDITGPIAGASSLYPSIGCFIVNASHPISASTSEPLVYVLIKFAVPSCLIKIQDNHKDYLASGPLSS